MGLRTDTLFFAQILGIFLFIQYYETDLIFTDPQLSATKAPVSSLQGLLRQISYPNPLFFYGKGVYGLLALLALGRFVFRPSLPDLFYLGTLGFNTYWYVTFLQPAITQFTSYATTDTARAFFPQLFFYQNVYLASLFLLLVESLLASFVYYVIDPIENILLNILLGVLFIDLSYDLPFLANPSSGNSQFTHITHGIGSSFLELQIPLILVAIGIIILYRTFIQKSLSDFIILLAFIASSVLFQTFLVPIETSLSKTTYSQRETTEDQKKVAFAHAAFTTLILAVTSFKWTLSWWSYSPVAVAPAPSIEKIDDEGKNPAAAADKKGKSPAKKVK